MKKMDDDALVRYGRSTSSMVKRSDRETWKIQPAEARAEWRRRAIAQRHTTE
jgi:hypothetical protein